VCRGRSVSYEQLIQLIEEYEVKLSIISENKIVGIEGDFSPSAIAILFCLIAKKAIVVPLDVKEKARNADKYSIAELDILLSLDAEDNFTITEFATIEKNQLYRSILGIESGLVLFTSGSSGKPKAALHNFGKLLKKFETPRPALRTINFLLFDHWGGLNTLFHLLSNHGTVYILENRSPEYVCSIIEKYRVELLPTSPTFLNMLLLSRAYEKFNLQSLKVISYGSEPMPESLLQRLHKVFPQVKLQQTYGLIELGVMRSKSESDESLWIKIGGEGFDFRIENGILLIKSESAMLGYLNADSPFTSDGYFITGDSVEQKGDYVRILGRKSELINVGGEKVFPQEVENVLLEMDFIDEALVYAEDNALTGKIVCAKIKYKSDLPHSEIVKKIKTYCRQKLATYKIPVKIIKSNEEINNYRFKKARV
jgi:acyl-CoA synthetase (AMP-forming)/AMP-acid ligase II